MNDINCTGLAPGELVMLLVDSQSPMSLLVLQSPKYVFVRSPMMAFDGKPVIAVTAAEAAERGLDTA